MVPQYNCTDTPEPLSERRWRLPWKDRHYKQKNLGSFVRTTLETAIKWMEKSLLSSSKDSASWTECCEGDAHCGIRQSGNCKHYATPKRQTVNAAFYWNFLELYVRPTVRRKRRHLLASNTIILHDNAGCHTTDAVGISYIVDDKRY